MDALVKICTEPHACHRWKAALLIKLPLGWSNVAQMAFGLPFHLAPTSFSCSDISGLLRCRPQPVGMVFKVGGLSLLKCEPVPPLNDYCCTPSSHCPCVPGNLSSSSILAWLDFKIQDSWIHWRRNSHLYIDLCFGPCIAAHVL